MDHEQRQAPLVAACILACLLTAGCGDETPPGAGPDLVPAACAGPLTAAAGSTITVSVGVRNNGELDAGPSGLAVYLSADGSIDILARLLSGRSVPALAPGEESFEFVTVTVPADVPPGDRYLAVMADSSRAVSESDESNNALAAVTPTTVTAASGVNLAVSSVSGPAAADYGDAITVSSTVVNTGASAAGPFVVSLYLSPDAEITSADVLIGSREVPSLGPGASDSAAASATVPVPDTGYDSAHWHVGAIADPSNAVAESDETDNAGVAAATIAVSSPPPVDAHEPDDSAAEASAVTVDGPAQTRSLHSPTDEDWIAVTVSSPTGIAASTAPYFPHEIYDADGATLLAVGAGAPPSASCFVDAPGTYYIRVFSWWSSGAYTLTVASYTPGSDIDLTVGSVSVPGLYPLPGDTLEAEVSVVAAGTDGCGVFSVDIYMSSDAIIDGGDVLLGRGTVHGVAPAGTAWTVAKILIPPGTAAGEYFVGAIADADDVVAETNEANNSGAPETVCVDPDVTAISISGPAAATAGDTVAVSYALQATTGYSWTAAMYLSDDAAYDEADVYLAALGPSEVGSANVILPVGMASGSYYFLLVTGRPRGTSVAASSPVSVAASSLNLPDLTMTGLSWTPTSVLSPGDTITVSDVVSNTGDAGAGAFAIEYRLLTGYHFAMPRCTLGERDVLSLAAGGSDGASTAFVIPPTPGGCYFLEARADAGYAVQEWSEDNNAMTAAGLVEIYGPDMTEPYSDAPGSAGLEPFIPESWDNDTWPVMTIHEAGDVDWLQLDIYVDGVTLKLETHELRGGMDTVMELWLAEFYWRPVAMLAIDDDSGEEAGASAITHTLRADKPYVLRIYHKDPAGTGFYKVKSAVVQ